MSGRHREEEKKKVEIDVPPPTSQFLIFLPAKVKVPPSPGEPSLIPLITAGSYNPRDLPFRSTPLGKSRTFSYVGLQERLWGRCFLPKPRNPEHGVAGKCERCKGFWPQPQPSPFLLQGSWWDLKKGWGLDNFSRYFPRLQSTLLTSKYALKMCPQKI